MPNYRDRKSVTDTKTALQYAVRLLAARPYSERRLREKLRDRGYDAESIDSAIARLTEKQLLDDRTFAEDFVRARCTMRPRGRIALVRDLISRGIGANLAQEVVHSAVGDEDEEALARNLVAQKASQYASLDSVTRRRRLTGLLARRGFRPQTIQAILEEFSDGEKDSGYTPTAEGGG